MTTPPAIARFCLYDSRELEIVMGSMAQKLASLSYEQPLVIIGILRRGAPLAAALWRYCHHIGAPAPSLHTLKVKRYSDDLSLVHPETLLNENPELAALNLAETPLLVVDDVLYEGHSLLRTCAYLARLGAQRIHTAVLVDRCVNTQPIHADIVGIRLQTAPDDIVECHVPPYEPDFRVEIIRHGQYRPPK
ncbi:phosphoribosyltransferase [Metapseudomonas lalkuanensis]|uniref:Phosphoribosyltransferase n=1 Tax=Metapseudomonas lalkuanensis TaxID=2604832 RepID=A0A5J6QR26_9GAMM|nr:phosphoribosyltransferase family protein [Pseudomonas lalkuanensis]QEY63136.1 phosphoribosyltransferase [Pseudomonas lalkuanensis]